MMTGLVMNEMLWGMKWWKIGVNAWWPSMVYIQMTNVYTLTVIFTGETLEAFLS